MNRRALYYALAYSTLVIALRLIILLGDYSLSTFGFFFSNVTIYFLIIPFYYLAVKQVRDRERGGIISGREAMRIALTVFAISAIITSAYNYIEFDNYGSELAEKYYRSSQYLDFLKSQVKVKPENYEQVITQQIASSGNDAFRATTGKLFSFMIIGLAAAFLTAIAMKRRTAKNRTHRL